MVYEEQVHTKAELIMGQDKKFVMVTQDAGLGMAAPGRERKSLMTYSNLICYIFFFRLTLGQDMPMTHLRSTDSTF